MRIVRPSQRTLGGVVLTLVFLTGAAVGITAHAIWSRSEPRAMLTASGMAGVLDELHLTPSQRVTADSILDRSAPQSEALMLEMARRMGSVADSVDVQLRAILTPQQRRRLDELRRKPVFLLRRRSKTGAEVVDTAYSGPRSGRP
jgi:hypothetical protein